MVAKIFSDSHLGFNYLYTQNKARHKTVKTILISIAIIVALGYVGHQDYITERDRRNTPEYKQQIIELPR